jgi:hypothetical protein
MEELVSFTTLKIKYPDQWVLIGNPQVISDEITGVLILHNESKRELATQFSKQTHQFSNTILRYTGTNPAVGKWLKFTHLN